MATSGNRLDMEDIITSVATSSWGAGLTHYSLTTLYVLLSKFVLQDGVNFAHVNLSPDIFLITRLRSRQIKSLAA
jgi:hypothetical protein